MTQLDNLFLLLTGIALFTGSLLIGLALHSIAQRVNHWRKK